MAERSEGPSMDRWIYGLALVVALIAGAAAIVESRGDGGGELRRVQGEDPAGGGVETPASGSGSVAGAGAASGEAAGGPTDAAPEPDIVPDLPEVPDLDDDPPPERPSSDEEDPRMARLGAEMRLLQRAGRLLVDHPAEALAVLQQHRQEHGDGVLREEREAFVVEALVALGRTNEAERRYYDFCRDFPESDLTERLEGLLRRSAGAAGPGGAAGSTGSTGPAAQD